MTNQQRDYDAIRKRDEQAAWIRDIIAQAQATGFYGKVSIHFERGVVQRVIKEESVEPPRKSVPSKG